MKKLLFVYNADSGVLNFLKDAAHKIFSPSTYPCSLCAITYTPTGLPRWRRFIKTLPWPVEFLHKDELADQYGAVAVDVELPAAFLWEDGELTPWIDSAEMNSYKSLDELMMEVLSRTTDSKIQIS